MGVAPTITASRRLFTSDVNLGANTYVYLPLATRCHFLTLNTKFFIDKLHNQQFRKCSPTGEVSMNFAGAKLGVPGFVLGVNCDGHQGRFRTPCEPATP